MRYGGQSVVSLPKMRTAPSRAGVSPTRLRSVVVLPAPLRPSSVTISPSPHLEADAVQDVALAVIGVQAFGLEHDARSAAAFPR